jgi:hypothetical protein
VCGHLETGQHVFGSVTGHLVPGPETAQDRGLCSAAGYRERAAWVEDASGRWIRGVWRITWQYDPAAASGDFDFGYRGSQRAGVGVRRGAQQDIGRADLGDLAQIEHRNLIAQLADHAEVMGDQQVGQLPFRAQPGDKFQDVRLGPDVEGAGGLVQHEQPWLHAERPGDGHALALAAGQLVRVPLGEGRL